MTVTRFQQKRGSSAQWAASVTPLRDGELGVDKDTGIIKVGDGFTLWPDLPTAFSSQYLPVLGKANDSYRLEGLSASDFLKKTELTDFATSASVTALNTQLTGLNTQLTALTAQTSATRKLVSHWGSGTSFPVVGVLQGDTFVRSDVGTGGSLWTYVGAGKGSNGWVHKGLLVCTSTTRPSVTYAGLEIFETDTHLPYLYDGVQWAPIGSSPWGYTLNSPGFGWGVPISPQKLPGTLASPVYVPPGRTIELELRIPQVSMAVGANGFIQIVINPNVTGNIVLDAVQMSESAAATGGQSLFTKLDGSWTNTAATTAACDIFAQAWSNTAANTLTLNAGGTGGNVVFRNRIA